MKMVIKFRRGLMKYCEPYIKSNLKFFVVKVNEEEKSKLPGNFLRPIQIRFYFTKVHVANPAWYGQR